MKKETKIKADPLILGLVLVLFVASGTLLFDRKNTQKQYDLYKHQTDSLFTVTQRAYETQLAKEAGFRDSLVRSNDDLVRDHIRLRQNEQSILKQLETAKREKYQTMSAKEKQAEMIKRARE